MATFQLTRAAKAAKIFYLYGNEAMKQSIDTPQELIANLEATAAKLAGRRVIVRIRKDPVAFGRMFKNLAGVCVIDLDPKVFEPGREEEFLKLFTHEAAHAKLHFDIMPRTDGEMPKVSEAIIKQAYASKARNPSYQQHEQEADALGGRWAYVVKSYYGSYTTTSEPMLAILQILYHRI